MNKAASTIFRDIAKARKSCHRFQPNLTIPESALKDILDVTLVSILQVCALLKFEYISSMLS